MKSKSQTTSKHGQTQLTHYIGMNGSHGCMPDSCNAYHKREDAVESLTDLLELTDEQKQELDDTGITECTNEQGAEYAEVSECSCLTPWEHQDERDQENEWPEYVKAHVMEFLSTLDTHEYQERAIEHSDRCRCAEHDMFYCQTWITKTLYLLPYACFGDYDSSSAVERSNARVFNELPFVSQRTGGYGTVWTGIDQDDADSITWQQLEELKDTCKGLADYPIIDEDDMSKLELEMQDEAWDSWAREDFKRELVKRFTKELQDAADDDAIAKMEDAIDGLSNERIDKVFYQAAEDSNTYWEIEAGGDAYIDLERVAKSVELTDLTADETEEN